MKTALIHLLTALSVMGAEFLPAIRSAGAVTYPATTIVNSAIFETDGSGNVVMTPKSVYAASASLSSYLTTATAASTYAPISTTVTLSGDQTLTGNKLFENLRIKSGSFYGAIRDDGANLTANRDYYPPNATGYIALTANTDGSIPVPTWTALGGGGTIGSPSFSGTVSVTGSLLFPSGGTSSIYGDSNGLLFTTGSNNRYTFYAAGAADVAFRIRLGGITSSFPQIKRSGTSIEFGLANDTSGGAVVCTGTLTVTGNGTMGNFKRGTGSPESVVTGNVGDLYTRTDGGAGTTLYVKESGTGNTGWVAK